MALTQLDRLSHSPLPVTFTTLTNQISSGLSSQTACGLSQEWWRPFGSEGSSAAPPSPPRDFPSLFSSFCASLWGNMDLFRPVWGLMNKGADSRIPEGLCAVGWFRGPRRLAHIFQLKNVCTAGTVGSFPLGKRLTDWWRSAHCPPAQERPGPVT